jgi:hypothetical protein
MKTVIWKFALTEPSSKGASEQKVEMPMGAKIICFISGRVYAMVNPEAPKEQVKFLVVPTGVEFDPTGYAYVASAGFGKSYVHLFRLDMKS